MALSLARLRVVAHLESNARIPPDYAHVVPIVASVMSMLSRMLMGIATAAAWTCRPSRANAFLPTPIVDTAQWRWHRQLLEFPGVYCGMKKLIIGLALFCGACVVQQPPPPQAVAVANPMPQNCREYNAQVMIGGQPQPAYGWACQQPDGSWRVSQEAPGQPPQMYVVPAAPAYPAGYPYWAYDPYWGPRIAIGGTFVFGGGHGFRHHHDFDHDRGFHRR